MTIEKKENSIWPGFPKNDPSVTDTVYVLITGGEKKWGALTDPFCRELGTGTVLHLFLGLQFQCRNFMIYIDNNMT